MLFWNCSLAAYKLMYVHKIRIPELTQPLKFLKTAQMLSCQPCMCLIHMSVCNASIKHAFPKGCVGAQQVGVLLPPVDATLAQAPQSASTARICDMGGSHVGRALGHRSHLGSRRPCRVRGATASICSRLRHEGGEW